jgi:hypothetical protein
MPEKYFEKFKLIQYSNTVAIDITQRVKVLSNAYNNPNLYYLDNIRPYERADNLAFNYYDDQYMSWILYLTNGIIDPYYDWNLDQDTFKNFIVKKYGTLENAVSKIKYYRNNWYNNQQQISVSSYNNLNENLKQYYEPVYLDELKSSTVYSYKRRRIDWKHNTNAVSKYNIANGSLFTTDEIVNVVFDTNNLGQGQIKFSNASVVILQHLSGVTTSGTITANSYLYGTESKTNTAFTTATSIANNISAIESSYWSPVTYYEHENEINVNNMSIKILEKSYSTRISKELKRLLK